MFDAKLDANFDAKIDTILDAKFDAKIDTILDAKLDANFDAKFDTILDAKLDAGHLLTAAAVIQMLSTMTTNLVFFWKKGKFPEK